MITKCSFVRSEDVWGRGGITSLIRDLGAKLDNSSNSSNLTHGNRGLRRSVDRPRFFEKKDDFHVPALNPTTVPRSPVNLSPYRLSCHLKKKKRY